MQHSKLQKTGNENIFEEMRGNCRGLFKVLCWQCRNSGGWVVVSHHRELGSFPG